ncbi:GTP cyclohydrolase-2 [Streptomyces davaonensis JCM 4913]|uniref:GTP cyclohydrolase II n=1 Tax=Streptomyces davaonensis (strain DSM 101723 / JCM 4913 / KCC S-0913 / 768) TaxID=1214101 RepID=K4REZ2_STRDJ|nr:GTP cyclohydrolase II [Streptomyces davaonensis]CCK32363.1 GTP cyclohydrolase-2 [Streptomyces davaonensis JCM 4913]
MPHIVSQASCTLPISGGEVRLHVFGRARNGPESVIAAVHRTERAEECAPLVRLHSACATGDILGSLRCDCGSQLSAALDAVLESDHGILLYLLDHEGRGIGLANKIRAYALQEQGMNTAEANLALGLPVDDRDYTDAAAVLREFGVVRLRLATNNPLKISALETAGLEVQRVPWGGFVTPHNSGYLETKDYVLGHLGSLGPMTEPSKPRS